jgi:hypothetical protein
MPLLDPNGAPPQATNSAGVWRSGSRPCAPCAECRNLQPRSAVRNITNPTRLSDPRPPRHLAEKIVDVGGRERSLRHLALIVSRELRASSCREPGCGRSHRLSGRLMRSGTRARRPEEIPPRSMSVRLRVRLSQVMTSANWWAAQPASQRVCCRWRRISSFSGVPRAYDLPKGQSGSELGEVRPGWQISLDACASSLAIGSGAES